VLHARALPSPARRTFSREAPTSPTSRRSSATAKSPPRLSTSRSLSVT
jgi:hypothetical protein